MTGLMMVFMLITAVYILRVDRTTTLIIDEYVMRQNLSEALQNEFRNDLKSWNAEILGDMTIVFKDPLTQFETGSFELKPAFKAQIASFFPRYVKIIRGKKFEGAIKEIRIEGHTSKSWKGVSVNDAYFNNMKLSQERTASTLRYIMSLPVFDRDQEWFRKMITANGMSSSRPRYKDDQANQRVEFLVVTNASDRLEREISTAEQ
jgi:outer membrane protein OmpA-like peptidoglycan-associated protein